MNVSYVTRMETFSNGLVAYSLRKLIVQLTFPQIISVRPRIGVLRVPPFISGLDNPRDLIDINLKKDNCFY